MAPVELRQLQQNLTTAKKLDRHVQVRGIDRGCRRVQPQYISFGVVEQVPEYLDESCLLPCKMIRLTGNDLRLMEA